MAARLSSAISTLSKHTAIRFLIVGGLSFIADAGSLFVLHGLIGVWLPLATALAYGVSFAVNFGLNRVWAFSSNGPMGRQLHRYLYLVAGNLVLTVIGVQTISSLGVPYLIAKVITATIAAVINYFAYRGWVFAVTPHSRGRVPAQPAGGPAKEATTATTVPKQRQGKPARATDSLS